MKKKYVLIILASTILGVFIGITLKDYKNKEELYITKDKIGKKEIIAISKSIKKLTKEKESLENDIENFKVKYDDKDKIKEVEELKKELSYTNVKGKGVVIKIDALNEEIGNIANFVDYNKILINITNELKLNGGKFISINAQRLNQYSEIVLAGNHININSVPIAPPYEIKSIGDEEKILKYIDKGSSYLESIQVNYPIKVDIKLEKNISMDKISLPNKLKYIKGE